MGYRVTAKIRENGVIIEDVFIAQYGGNSIVEAGRKAFDKVQQLLAKPSDDKYSVISASYTRTKNLCTRLHRKV